MDTIEDDMTAFPSNDVKVSHLLRFHETALSDPTWSMDGVGEADERRLLQEFPKCHSVYSSLRGRSREVISDIAERMAGGMAEFVIKDLGQGTADLVQYDRYCHFVAGLVGEGLSRLFSASGLESPSLAREVRLSDRMGLFLQKTNIIRDYLEDYVDGRAFWPRTVWEKHSPTGDLGYFATSKDDPDALGPSLACLNELVTDALELVPDCLSYLSRLRCEEVYRFCAIPQVMAIATLDKCYANPDVFTGVVKIRKGLSCRLILDASDRGGVSSAFHGFATSIADRAAAEREGGTHDPSRERTLRACDAILKRTKDRRGTAAGGTGGRSVWLVPLAAAAAVAVPLVSSRSNQSRGQGGPSVPAALFAASLGLLGAYGLRSVGGTRGKGDHDPADGDSHDDDASSPTARPPRLTPAAEIEVSDEE